MYGELTTPHAKGFIHSAFSAVGALFAIPTASAAPRLSAWLADPVTEKQATSGQYGHMPMAPAFKQQPTATAPADRQESVSAQPDRLTMTTARVCAAIDPQSHVEEAEALRAALKASELAREIATRELEMLQEQPTAMRRTAFSATNKRSRRFFLLTSCRRHPHPATCLASLLR
jgi:hypothetical protein